MKRLLLNNLKGLRTHFPNLVYKLSKALYGLKQASWAWYERLTNFLIEKWYKRRGVNKILGELIKYFFIMHFDTGIIIAQIYVANIVFGSTSPLLTLTLISRHKVKVIMIKC